MWRDRLLDDEFISTLRGSRTVLLGVGNTLKADDAIGPLICQRLAGHSSATAIDAGTVPENHIRSIVRAEPDYLLIIDAIDFGGFPGQVRVFRLEEVGTFAFSTHALSLHLFLNIVCQEVNVTVYLLGVQPDSTELGRPIAKSVQRTVDLLTGMLKDIFPVEPLHG